MKLKNYPWLEVEIPGILPPQPRLSSSSSSMQIPRVRAKSPQSTFENEIQKLPMVGGRVKRNIVNCNVNTGGSVVAAMSATVKHRQRRVTIDEENLQSDNVTVKVINPSNLRIPINESLDSSKNGASNGSSSPKGIRYKELAAAVGTIGIFSSGLVPPPL
eukprot:CAMPEP_0184871616 /NCGR_PEP_ID=MMETSP0580-20130426/40823_1 /TAXON_ID=1118495 /ORGANISM="Dactyliosolen fragilissimus" /LENGTH=159 /DNA_ID=CAMNT_0027374303 /DNA_START=408 /DNA_END=887 /DNA_ORIENTATION=+